MRSRPSRRATLAATLAGAAIVVAGCAGSSGPGGRSAASSAPETSATATSSSTADAPGTAQQRGVDRAALSSAAAQLQSADGELSQAASAMSSTETEPLP